MEPGRFGVEGDAQVGRLFLAISGSASANVCPLDAFDRFSIFDTTYKTIHILVFTLGAGKKTKYGLPINF